MPRKTRTEAWRKKRRQEHLEMKKYRYYIFCEGQETEPNYFQGFKKWIEENPIYKDMVLIEIEPCQAETMRVIGMAEEYVKMGFFIGMGGVLTFKNAKKLVRCAERIPLSSIVLETDCPYMAPEPYRGKRNSSLYLPYVVEKIAGLKGVTAKEVEEVTYRNAEQLFLGK